MNRLAPGAWHTSLPKIPYVFGPNDAVRLRPDSAANTTRAISLKAGHSPGVLNFGDEDVADPTADGGALFEPSDGWMDIVLPPGITHVRIFGVGNGTLYVWDRGNLNGDGMLYVWDRGDLTSGTEGG